jgi:RNA polymerase sigma factor (sigma-70 family)
MTATAAAETVDRFTPLLLAICGRFSQGRDWMRADLVSDSSLRLWRAAVERDQAEEFTAALARVVITRACLSRLRSEKSKAPEMFATGPPVLTDGEPVDLLDTVAGSERDPAEVAELLDLPPLLAGLGARERELVVRHVGHGEPLQALADERGVGAPAVGQMIRRCVAGLRRAAGCEE